ncbi:telomere repeats-binding bouquet formation protein 1 [Trichonephila clavipes]|nr:telomere repeats-binding bouquet formation protein 1 [Trichonephila clavipes]
MLRNFDVRRRYFPSDWNISIPERRVDKRTHKKSLIPFNFKKDRICMEIENYEALKMDFQNLMSCIHCHEDSERNEVVLETLKTIVDICSHESCGRDAFREEGGLDFLVEFLFMTDNTTFLEHTLKTLAYVIDENVHSQMFTSKRSIFEIIQTILKKPTFPQEVWKNALLLISTILYNNSTAQSLALEIGLIQDLLNMYENCVQAVLLRSSIIVSPSNGFTVDLWLRTNSALCFAVNNPQNERVILVAVADDSIFSLFLRMVLIVEVAKFSMQNQFEIDFHQYLIF